MRSKGRPSAYQLGKRLAMGDHADVKMEEALLGGPARLVLAGAYGEMVFCSFLRYVSATGWASGPRKVDRV